MFIAHFPFTTLARFERKVHNIRDVFAVPDAYFGQHLAWHWRRWLALQSADDIRAEFRRQSFDDDTLAALRRDGSVQSVADWYAAHAVASWYPGMPVGARRRGNADGELG
jgi:hypothetical protein